MQKHTSKQTCACAHTFSPLSYDAGSILQSCLPCIALQLCPKLVISHGNQQTLDNPSNILQVHEASQRWPVAPWCQLLRLAGSS